MQYFQIKWVVLVKIGALVEIYIYIYIYKSKNWYKYAKDTYFLDKVANGLLIELNELPSQYSRYTYPSSSKENEVIFCRNYEINPPHRPTPHHKKKLVHSTLEYKKNDIKFENFLSTINMSICYASIMTSKL